jgi:hypothetical protein
VLLELGTYILQFSISLFCHQELVQTIWNSLVCWVSMTFNRATNGVRVLSCLSYGFPVELKMLEMVWFIHVNCHLELENHYWGAHEPDSCTIEDGKITYFHTISEDDEFCLLWCDSSTKFFAI